nr:syntaxin binding protein 5 [Hymenolepis microstoma]
MEGQQYQMQPGGGPIRPQVQRNPQVMAPQMQQHRQQPQQYQQQPVMQQPPPQQDPFLAYENPEVPIVPSLLADQQSLHRIDPFFGSQPRGNMMQEVFIQGSVSIGQKNLLLSRLRGLCKDHSAFTDQEESYSFQGLPTSVTTGTPTFVNFRVRRTLQPNIREYVNRSVIRYLGAVESIDRIYRRSYLEASAHGLVGNFLKCLGFKQDFEFIAEGQIFIRGRAKALVYSVHDVNCQEMQMPIPKKNRNLVPNSLMVEVTAVGSPSDDTLQREVVELMELLHPLVVPGLIDYGRLAMR